jgi:hypothetical protein
MPRPLSLALLLVASQLAACSETREKLDDARAAADGALAVAKVPSALELLDLARTAFDLLDLAPTYTCGEPRGTFAGKVADGMVLRYPCITASLAAGAAADVLTATLPDSGCRLRGHRVSGAGAFSFSGGEDRLELAADLRALAVDGRPLQTEVGYGTCGDATTYWARTDGTLPRHPEKATHLDLHVTMKDGLPLIGDTDVTIDGTGTLTEAGATDALTAIAIAYRLGELNPTAGTLVITTANGHTVTVTFFTEACDTSARVVVDDHPAITIPLG